MNFMTGNWLALLKVRALRRRTWYALSRMERSVVDLTLSYVDEIRSEKLSLVIGRIACKILKSLRNSFIRNVEQIGHSLAERLSETALSWGNITASAWKQDLGFILYLGLNITDCRNGFR
ncbi:MAG: hypothetical protein QG670_2056 [Thermoproteota archaeon]|nr:hypothetical protein [Thermoproteota archaeon]